MIAEAASIDIAPEPGTAGTANIVLDARDIVKELGSGARKVRALKGVNLALRAGELTLLMGPSGSGKTTLLSILGCILSPTSGTLTVAGHPTADMSPEQLAALRRRYIGFIFQSYNLFPTLSAEQNVKLALDLRGQRGSEDTIRAQRALQQVGLRHRMKSFPGNLSGGEQQRVAVARALAPDPALLLADEPTGNLDPERTIDVMELLHGANARGTTVVVATHDRSLLERYKRRVVVLEAGRLLSDGDSIRRAVS